MSYSIKCAFYIDKAKVADCYVDKLKNLTEYRYSANFENVEAAPADLHEGIEINEEDLANGLFYDKKSFENAFSFYKKELKKLKKELKKKRKVLDSVEYYSLPVEKRDEFLDDLQICNEAIEDEKCKVNACRYMVNLFDFYTDDFINPLEGKNEEGYSNFNYDRKVVAYIYAV